MRTGRKKVEKQIKEVVVDWRFPGLSFVGDQNKRGRRRAWVKSQM